MGRSLERVQSLQVRGGPEGLLDASARLLMCGVVCKRKVVTADLDDRCTAEVDFNVPGSCV